MNSCTIPILSIEPEIPNERQKKNTQQSFDKQNKNQQTKPVLNKYRSQPKFRSQKEEILKIPKVRQILHKDKFIYAQDIQKRMQLLGNVKNQNYEYKQLKQLRQMRKPIQTKSKNKRHKTNYKIPLTKKNMSSLNNLIKEHISHNQKFKNQEIIFLSQTQYKQPFDLSKLKFMDQINPLKKRYKQKFPDLKEGVLTKNKLLLQHVILNRNIKRQIKLQQKKQSKLKQKHIYQQVKSAKKI